MKLLAFIVLLSSFLASAAVDLVGDIDETSIKFFDYDSGGGDRITDIYFSVEVQNIGNERAEGIFYLKPAMFSLDKSDHFRGAKGATLESEGYYISIAPGETKNLIYQQTLPNLSLKSYGLFVILNSRSTITETSQLNNNTKVVGVGNLESNRARKPIGFDFYTEINKGQVLNIASRASSGFRTVGKGDLSYFPSSEIDDSNLWARFLLFDYETYEVHTMIYSGTNPANVEKSWCCLPWRSERDQYGSPIGVDYYSQAPSFDHVSPGDYLYLSVINSRDLIQEDTLANNLDVFPFNISVLNSIEKRAWFSINANNPGLTRKTIKLVTDYRDTIPYTYEVIGIEGFTVSGSGAISRSENLTLTFDPSDLDLSEGTDQRGELLIKANYNGELQTLSIPLAVFVVNETDTVLSSNQLDATILQSEIPSVQKLILENTGSEVASFVLDVHQRNHRWINIPEGEISLMVGQSIELDIDIDHYAKGPGRHSQKIILNTSHSSQVKEIRVNVDILAQ